MPLPDNIYNWLVSFLANHSHYTASGDETSPTEYITASVIQGSAIGPAAFIINAADLAPIDARNIIFKYADCLIVTADSENTRQREIENIQTWADINNLKLNKKKSIEVVFYNSKARKQLSINPPPPLPGIPRAEKIKILGVTLENNFSMQAHVDETVSTCAQSMYALKILRAHGMTTQSLCTVFNSVIVSKLSYASPAWLGFAKEQDKNRIEALLNRGRRSGFRAANAPSFQSTCKNLEQRLFDSITNNQNHVLQQLLPPESDIRYNLRQRAHPYVLPPKVNSLIDANFMSRTLYGMTKR